jgi:hypothetical protein
MGVHENTQEIMAPADRHYVTAGHADRPFARIYGGPFIHTLF